MVYEDVFLALHVADVPFVVVGGVAVVLHGHARFTVDLDLVIDLATERVEAAIAALLALGLRPRLPVDAHAFADPAIRAEWVATKHLQVFSMHDPDNPFREVDVFATHPLPFHDLIRDSVPISLGTVTVHIASIPHLVALKRAAGRPQDLADIDALLALQEEAGDA